nr:MAG TPA: hypothetical protein [Caudoviricetes sp.]
MLLLLKLYHNLQNFQFILLFRPDILIKSLLHFF